MRTARSVVGVVFGLVAFHGLALGSYTCPSTCEVVRECWSYPASFSPTYPGAIVVQSSTSGPLYDLLRHASFPEVSTHVLAISDYGEHVDHSTFAQNQTIDETDDCNFPLQQSPLHWGGPGAMYGVAANQSLNFRGGKRVYYPSGVTPARCSNPGPYHYRLAGFGGDLGPGRGGVEEIYNGGTCAQYVDDYCPITVPHIQIPAYEAQTLYWWAHNEMYDMCMDTIEPGWLGNILRAMACFGDGDSDTCHKAAYQVVNEMIHNNPGLNDDRESQVGNLSVQMPYGLLGAYGWDAVVSANPAYSGCIDNCVCPEGEGGGKLPPTRVVEPPPCGGDACEAP